MTGYGILCQTKQDLVRNPILFSNVYPEAGIYAFAFLAASSRWRQISAQLGSFATSSASPFIAAGISIFCGHIFAHFPSPVPDQTFRLKSFSHSVVPVGNGMPRQRLFHPGAIREAPQSPCQNLYDIVTYLKISADTIFYPESENE